MAIGRRSSSALGLLAGTLLLVCFLYLSVASFAFSPRNYPASAPYQEMAAQLIAYLRGETSGLGSLFSMRETLHMADVLYLFQMGRALALGCGLLCAALCVAAAWVGDFGRFLKGIRMGIGLFLGVVAAIGIWAALDFEGWFVWMHERVFSNDLWLLDPAESLLIQMLPQSFFEGAVLRIARSFGLSVVALFALTFPISRICIRKK